MGCIAVVGMESIIGGGAGSGGGGGDTKDHHGIVG
jgi:hypothetical protein